MAWHMPIASGGEGLFWFVVVLFVIISKIVKATKKDPSPPAGSPRPLTPASTGEFSPEEELRDFLKRLSQGADQPPPPVRPVRPVATPQPLPAETMRTTTSSQPGASRTTAPHPVYPPPPVHKPHRASPRRAARSMEPPCPQPAVCLEPPCPQPAFFHAATEPVCVPTPYALASPAAGDKRRANLVAFLKDQGSLREAIILREILDQPLAMRRQATHAFTA